jgi:hypothetical protein
MKKGIQISLDNDLWERAHKHAKLAHGTSFSGMVTKLILNDLAESPDIKLIKVTDKNSSNKKQNQSS